jgi:hypothetical protein
MKKSVLTVFLLPLLLFASCSRVDFDAFLTFVVYEIDYETSELDGAAVFSYTNPKLNPNESIPLDLEYLEATVLEDGFASINYPLEDTQMFHATLSFNGEAEILTPQFTPSEELEVIEKQAGFIAGFTLIPILKAPPIEYREFWEIIKNYSITSNITDNDMTGYIYLHEAVTTDPSTWKWILMLAH